MSYTKWIGGALGWSFGGPIGAIIGLVVGSIVDNMSNAQPSLKEPLNKNKYNSYRSEANYSTQKQYRAKTQSGDFEVSLLILASIVIKADGKQDRRELDFVRQHFLSMYGKERANSAFKLFKGFSKQRISKRQVCFQIKQMMDYPSRLQLLHFLFGIAKSDGSITELEIKEIYIISGYLGLSNQDYESIKAMFNNSQKNPYKILEIEKTALDEEVKRAYRKMVKKYHPDRLNHLGNEHQKGAEDKFLQVQEAYEYIQNERGFK